MAAAEAASVIHDTDLSVVLPGFRLETDGSTESAKANTVASMSSINVRAHIIVSSKNISPSTTNGVARSINLKGNIVTSGSSVLRFCNLSHLIHVGSSGSHSIISVRNQLSHPGPCPRATFPRPRSPRPTERRPRHDDELSAL